MRTGSQEYITGQQSRRNVDLSRFARPFTGTKAAWHISVSNGVATLTECVYMRGMVTHRTAELTVSVSGETESYISARINTVNGVADLLSGALSAVVDDTQDISSEYVKVLLYKLIKVGGSWFVETDYRSGMLFPVIYQ